MGFYLNKWYFVWLPVAHTSEHEILLEFVSVGFGRCLFSQRLTYNCTSSIRGSAGVNRRLAPKKPQFVCQLLLAQNSHRRQDRHPQGLAECVERLRLSDSRSCGADSESPLTHHDGSGGRGSRHAGTGRQAQEEPQAPEPETPEPTPGTLTRFTKKKMPLNK